jgi:uncharacterized membrane protein YkoI
MARLAGPALALAILAGATTASSSDHETARILRDAGSILPLEKIFATLPVTPPARLLEAELHQRDGIYVYEIEVLDGVGRVWELLLDAGSGRLLQRQRED